MRLSRKALVTLRSQGAPVRSGLHHQCLWKQGSAWEKGTFKKIKKYLIRKCTWAACIFLCCGVSWNLGEKEVHMKEQILHAHYVYILSFWFSLDLHTTLTSALFSDSTHLAGFLYFIAGSQGRPAGHCWNRWLQGGDLCMSGISALHKPPAASCSSGLQPNSVCKHLTRFVSANDIYN